MGCPIGKDINHGPLKTCRDIRTLVVSQFRTQPPDGLRDRCLQS
jgi:hypothetical protein